MSDHIDGANWHLPQRDVTLLAVSRAPLAEIEAFKQRMGWRFKWVSSYDNDFNHDFHVSFTPDEMARGEVYYNYTMTEFPSKEAPGLSAFYKVRAARSSTPTRPTRAGSTCWSARTTISTSRQRAATRRSPVDHGMGAAP